MKKPIAKETLFTYAKDVIALSGGYNGELATLVRLGKFKEAVDLAQLMREALGEDHWYVQLELSTETHKQVARKMFELLPKSEFVASQKITYLRSEEQQIVRTLKALKDGKTLEENKDFGASF